MIPRAQFYDVEYARRGDPDRWRYAGSFEVGRQWRDDRPVNDETMAEELVGYKRKWPQRFARIRKPDGTYLT
jgi:hypothetical protein